MLTKMTAFLARAPALQGLSLTVGDVGPAPYTAGLWCRGSRCWTGGKTCWAA